MVLKDTLLGMLLNNVFSRGGFEVKVFYGNQGIKELAMYEKPDIILYGVLLEEIQGRKDKIQEFQIINMMKRDEKIKDIPIFILSDVCYGDIKRKGLQSGADNYLCLELYPPYKILEFITDFLISTGKFDRGDFDLLISEIKK